MSELGHGIMGDWKYECDRETPNGVGSGLHLHARALRLPRKHGRSVEVVAPMYEHMIKTFDVLGFNEKDVSDPFESVPEMSKKKH